VSDTEARQVAEHIIFEVETGNNHLDLDSGDVEPLARACLALEARCAAQHEALEKIANKPNRGPRCWERHRATIALPEF
jgi:hypothetical protein